MLGAQYTSIPDPREPVSVRPPDRVKGPLESRIAAALAWWVAQVSRRAVAVLVGAGAVTAVLSVYAALNLGVNSDQNDMFSQDLPHRILELEFAERFPLEDQNVVVLIDAATAERASDAAIALAEKLAERPDLFENIYLPRDAFFDEHGLLYMETDDLEVFADRLARVQPYLAGLAEDGSLRGLANMLERGAAAVRDGEVEGIELEPMLERFADAIDARLAGRPYHLSWAEVVAGRELGKDERRRFLFVHPKLQHEQFVAGRASMSAIRAAAEELELDAASGVRVRITGDIALAYEEMQRVEVQSRIAGTVSFVIVTILLMIGLRSLHLVIATAVTLLTGLAWTAGFATAAVGYLNIISVAFTVLFIGLAVDFGIHFCLRYRELIGSGETFEAALDDAARTVGTSILLCSVTTSIGFFAFVPTDFAGVAQLGLIAGVGIFLGFIATMTILPAILTLGTRSIPALRKPRAARALTKLPLRHPRSVSTAALSLGIAAAMLLPEVHFDQNPLRARDPGAESVQVFEELLREGRASPWDLSVITEDLAAAESLAERLRELDVVDTAMTLSDYVPPAQDEKLSIIEDVALFLAPPAESGKRRKPTVDEQVAAIRSFAKSLDGMIADTDDADLRETATRTRAAVGALLDRIDAEPEDTASLLDDVETSLLGELPERLDLLQRAVNVAEVTLDRLPSGLVERMLTADGSARVIITPAEDVNDDDALRAFVEGVRTVAPTATGGAIGVYEHARTAVRAFQQALTSAVVVIVILLLLIWRTLGDTALVLTPLALASLLTAAATVVLDIPFNFADIIVLPLLLGIGVDSGIHLVHRARNAHDRGENLLETSTARGVLYSSLTTVASFGSLGLATHRGMASMGQLLTVGVALAVLCNLFFLPAFVTLANRLRERGTIRP